MAYTLIKEARSSIERSDLHQANTMVKTLAEGSLDALAVNDYELIESWLKASNSLDGFAYAYLSKSDGLIISHTEPEMVAKYTNSLGELSKPLSRNINYKGRDAIEVVYAAYLGKKHMANAHIAYYLDDGFWDSGNIISRLLGMLLVLMLMLSFSTFLILRWGLKPIEVLSNVIQKISNSKDYSVRAVKQSDDVIGVLVKSFNDMLDQIQLRDTELMAHNEKTEKLVEEAQAYAQEVVVTNKELQEEIKERQNAEDKLLELSVTLEKRVKDRTIELEELNKVISEVSRSAGMSEVASGILHNVGNILNSVNVSSSVIRQNIRNTGMQNLSKIVDMLEENKEQLSDYITSDSKGKKIPEFLRLLTDKLKTEHTDLFNELDELDKNIDHIKNVVSTQQSYAGNYGVIESVKLTDLIEDALKINLSELEKNGMILMRKFDDIPVVELDKHKVLQVIINLISNAKHALKDSDNPQKILTLSLYRDEGRIVFSVEDSGVGIKADDIPHLFEYGFKKRDGGHGFGLHNSALVANELGGKITVESEGPGKGACFKFILN